MQHILIQKNGKPTVQTVESNGFLFVFALKKMLPLVSFFSFFHKKQQLLCKD